MRPILVRLFTGIGVFMVAVLTALPWYALAEAQNPGYLRYFFLDRHLLGLVTASQPHGHQPWWYYLPILLGGGLPWIGYLPVAIRAGDFDGRVSRQMRDKACSHVVVLDDRLDAIADGGRVEAGHISLAGVSADGHSGGSGLGEGLKRHARRNRPKDRSPERSSGRRWQGRSCCRRPCWRCSRCWRCSSVGRFGRRSGMAAAAAPLPLLPWYAGRRQASLAAAALVAGRAVCGGDDDGASAGGRDRISARELAEHFNHLGQLPPRLLVAEEADRLVCVLS